MTPQALILPFWKMFGRKIPQSAIVSYCPNWVSLVGISDSKGEKIPGLGPLPGKVAFFFVDLVPDATWAHECSYVLLSPDGGVAKADHVWPPNIESKLVVLDRT